MTQKTLTLPLVWRELGNSDGDAQLMLGPLRVGETMFMPKSGVWCAIGGLLTAHRSTNHPTRSAAQAALEEAVMALGVKAVVSETNKSAPEEDEEEDREDDSWVYDPDMGAR